MSYPASHYKQIGAVVVAAGILVALFVPLSKAAAFEANLTFPYADPSSVPRSAEGVIFLVTIEVAPNELVSLSQIELILDNDTPQVKHAMYDADGFHISGDTDLTLRQIGGDLTVGVPADTVTGYGYGYGIVSYGTSFVPPYSYSFTALPGFLSGNEYGYSYAVAGANLVDGFLGPGIITIVGKLNTAAMDVGPHTLDVLVHTGAGGDGIDKIVPPPLAFNVVEDPDALADFEANLSGSEEVPPVDTDASGHASFMLGADGTELNYSLMISNISNMTQAHIHLGAPGVNGPVVAFLFDLAVPGAITVEGLQAEGTITADDLVGPLEGMTVDDLIDEMTAGNTYVNVHTLQNPAGEIRGQISEFVAVVVVEEGEENDTQLPALLQLTTDQPEYRVGEDVVFTAENLGSEDLVFPDAALGITITNADTGTSYGIFAAQVLTSIEAGQSMQVVWQQQQEEEIEVEPGNYVASINTAAGTSPSTSAEASFVIY